MFHSFVYKMPRVKCTKAKALKMALAKKKAKVKQRKRTQKKKKSVKTGGNLFSSIVKNRLIYDYGRRKLREMYKKSPELQRKFPNMKI